MTTRSHLPDKAELRVDPTGRPTGSQAESFRCHGKFFLPTLHLFPCVSSSALTPCTNPTPNDISRKLGVGIELEDA